MAKDLYVEIVDREVHKHGQVLTVQYFDHKLKDKQVPGGKEKEYRLEGSFRLTYGNDQTEDEILASIRSEVQILEAQVSVPPSDMRKHMGKKIKLTEMPTANEFLKGA